MPFILCLIFVLSAAFVQAAPVNVSLKSIPGTDRTADLSAALEKVRASREGGTITLAPGDYLLASPIVIADRVSNHDTPRERRVFLPIQNVTNLVIKSKGARILCDGEGIACGIINASNIRVKGVVFDYTRPFFSIWTLKDKKLTPTDTKEYSYTCDDQGIIFSTGTGWRERQKIAEFFDGTTRRFLGSVWWDGSIHREFNYPDGTIAMTRSPYRPNPCVFLYRASSVSFVDSGAYAAAGMGFLAQRSEDILLQRWKTHGTRPIALQADATHFSNCRGRIAVIDGVFEGMVDDAINVHSTSLKIVEQPAPNVIVCRFMHHQSKGFEVFRPGEELRPITGDTLEPGESIVVTAVEAPNADFVRVTLAKPLPEMYKVGDAVENATWQPSVVFKGNTVRNSSPRATLFTTPGKIICENNRFENVAGQPIYFAGDARNWYESGACRDVVIRKNVFKNCGYLSGLGMIQIEPTVHDLKSQKEPYHRNILVEDNVFDTFRLPLVWARSCANVVLRNNKIVDGNEKTVLNQADVKVEK